MICKLIIMRFFGSYVFNLISIILEILSLVLSTTGAAAVSGVALLVTYVIHVVYLIFSLCGLVGVYHNRTALVKTAVVGYFIKGLVVIAWFGHVCALLGGGFDLGTDPTVLVVAGLISKCW
jgi:hypothetical protein